MRSIGQLVQKLSPRHTDRQTDRHTDIAAGNNHFSSWVGVSKYYPVATQTAKA